MRMKAKSNVEKCIKLLDDAHDVYSDILYYESLRVNGDDEKKKIADNMLILLNRRYSLIWDKIESLKAKIFVVKRDSHVISNDERFIMVYAFVAIVTVLLLICK